MKDENTFTLNELSSLADVSVRTIRYYIQSGLLTKPLGQGRGAHYNSQHLEQLLLVKKWSDAGLSLQRIGEILNGQGLEDVPPVKPRSPGEVEVWSHLYVTDGVQINIEPRRAGLSPEQVRQFTRQVMEIYREINGEQGDEDNESG